MKKCNNPMGKIIKDFNYIGLIAFIENRFTLY